jgi:hypothetical protein
MFSSGFCDHGLCDYFTSACYMLCLPYPTQRSVPENSPFKSLHINFHFVCVSNHCATSRKVAGSIPDGVTGIFQ